MGRICPSYEKITTIKRMRALMGEDFESGFGYEDVIFYADSELAGHVYAGLDCDDLAGFEFTFAVRF